MLTTGEAARLLGVTSQTVINWVEAGRLPAVRVGRGRRRIAPACLRQFVEENAIPAERNAPDLWVRVASATAREPGSLPPVFAIDAAGFVVFWSRAVEALLGWTVLEREGRAVSELPVRVPGLPVDLADLARDPGEEVKLSLRLEYSHRDGRTISTETTVSWIRDAAGAVVGAAFVLQPLPSDRPRASPPRRGRRPKG